jgi:TonB-dependent receptor
MTALIVKHGGNVPAAQTEFQANLTNGQLNQGFVDQILGQFDVVPDASDPLLQFQVNGPVNNREGHIDGVELAFQHFFGDTGFGVQANYTLVEGDVEADVTASPTQDQFALLGLSDTANATLIYENYGISARLSYNWRDEFLAATNINGGNRNPLFVDPFTEVDLNVSYDLNDNIQLSFEGLNLTGEDLRTHARSDSAFIQVQDLGPRYLIGARYRF